jgi:hypothetical protein
VKINSNLANELIAHIKELTTMDQFHTIRTILKSFKGNGPKRRVQAMLRQRSEELNDLVFSQKEIL